MQTIPKWFPKSSQEPIPESVAEPSFEEDPEAKPFLISYFYYKDKECGLKNLLKNGPRKVLQDFRNIGQSTNITQFKQYNIDTNPVHNNGDYSKLYYGLPPDAELKENAIQGAERFFYFIIGRIFYLVAIKQVHLETNKVRRK